MRLTKKRPKYARLPPHSNQASPLANLGEMKKPLVIAMVTIIALIVLSLLLFYSGKFVGKAISFGALGEGQAGILLAGNTIDDGSQFHLTVKANIGAAQTVAVGFRLNLPDGIRCDNVDSLLGWTDGVVEETARCVTSIEDPTAANSYVLFSYATLNTDNAKTGQFDIADITLTETGAANSYPFTFDSFSIFNLADAAAAPIALELINPTLQVTVPGLETHSCTGLDPSFAVLCLNDDRDLIADANKVVVDVCTDGTKCEYTCAAGYHNDGGTCVADAVPGTSLLPFSSTTTITASAAVTAIPEAIVYTILKDARGTVLVLKSEKIFNLQGGQTYAAEVSYPYPDLVVTKEVNVWDKLPDQGWTVHGQLTRNVADPVQSVDGAGITLQG